MAPRKGRHPRRTKGPGGPRRTSRVGDNVIPISRAPSARPREGLLAPSVDNLVRTLLSSLRKIAPSDPESRPIGIEVWADRMAATVYGADQMPDDFYADLADGLLVSDDPDARPALAALAHVLDHPDAEPLRRTHADHRAGLDPADPSDLGIGRATARRGFEIDHVQGDGVSLVVDLDQPGAPHCVGVYIDHNMGGLAKDLLVGPPWTALVHDRTYEGVPGMAVREIRLDELRARCAEAIALTDHSIDPPVAEDFDDVRALVERRMALLPTGGAVPERDAPEDEEIEELVGAFLRSPEASALREADRDEAGWLVDLWINHATGHAIGDPHRVSPTLIEVFCVDWYPRKVVADAATAAAAPAVLEAWTRYAARVTGLADEWRDEALRALAAYAPAMADDAPGPSRDGGRLDDLDPELREVLLGATEELSETDRVGVVRGPFDRSPDDAGQWSPLQPGQVGPRRLHPETEPVGVAPELVTKVKAICAQCRLAADRLLGGAFVAPAVDLAVRIGVLDPSPLPHTQDRAWTSAIVWLLAEDSGAFSQEPGRTRDDLATDLPLTRASVTKRVAQIRDRLGLEVGDLAVAW